MKMGHAVSTTGKRTHLLVAALISLTSVSSVAQEQSHGSSIAEAMTPCLRQADTNLAVLDQVATCWKDADAGANVACVARLTGRLAASAAITSKQKQVLQRCISDVDEAQRRAAAEAR